MLSAARSCFLSCSIRSSCFRMTSSDMIGACGVGLTDWTICLLGIGAGKVFLLLILIVCDCELFEFVGGTFNSKTREYFIINKSNNIYRTRDDPIRWKLTVIQNYDIPSCRLRPLALFNWTTLFTPTCPCG